MTGFVHTEKPVSEAYEVFFEALKYNSPGQIIKKAFEFFGMPVLLTDAHYQLISIYPEEEIGVEIYDTLLKKHILPADVIENYQKMYLSIEDPHYEPFYADSGLVEGCPRIFGEVFSGSQIYGHFAIMMFDQPLLENDMKCASILKDALRLSMTPKSSYDKGSYDGYLGDLLDPEASSDLRLFAAAAIEKSVVKNYTLMVTPIGRSAGQYAFASMIRTRVPLQYYGAISTIYSDCIVTLFGSIKGEAYTDSEMTFLTKYAESLRLSGKSGLSVPFDNLLTLPERFYEAYLSSVSGNDQLSLFSEQMPAPLFRCLCSRIDPSVFVHPAIYRMTAYDSENHTEYYETLRQYSLLMHSKDRTAAALHIHRNTLLYRLNRACELFDISVEDPDTALYLLNSFQLLDSMKNRTDNQKLPGCSC